MFLQDIAIIVKKSSPDVFGIGTKCLPEFSHSGYSTYWNFRPDPVLGSISAVSRVRSLILPGGWVRAHFPEQRLVIEPNPVSDETKSHLKIILRHLNR